MTSTSHARRTIWDAAVGAAAALLVFAAVPGVLAAFVGLPVPRHWSVQGLASWHGLFDLLAIVSWCAWAMCAWPILRSVVVRVRSGDPGTAVRLADRIAVRIAVGLLAISSFLGLGTSMAGASMAGASMVGAVARSLGAPTAAARPMASLQSSPMAQASVAHAAARVQNGPRAALHTVGQGDTLARIATARYGDASAWPAIAAANLGRLMGDRTRFVDPSVIAPGWTLVLPSLDAQVAPDTLVAADTQATFDAQAASDAHRDAAPASTGPVGRHVGGGALLPLGELAAAGVSALVAGLLARRSRQLSRLRAFLREEGADSLAPVEREADLGTLVAPFEQVPVVDLIEAAARRLAHAIATLDPSPGPVQWLRAGRDGVEVRFFEPAPDALDGWRRTAPANWLLPASADAAELRRAHGGEPWCLVLLPLGDDERGTWLIPVETGTRVSVIGPRAADLALTMRAAAATWSWHEGIVIVDDAHQAVEAVRGVSQRVEKGQAAGPHVLFVGDPDTLPEATRRACAVLATRQLDDADVTVVVDDRAASAHPLGLTLRPPLLDSSWKEAVDALVDHGTPSTRVPARPLVQRRTAPATLRLADPAARDQSGLLELSAMPDEAKLARGRHDGAVVRESLRAEVQLLTTVPGIVGLQADLPPKRARRAVEVIAYLAMHSPDPVTGERLRMRVLGSADVDAAAKTLFNTVSAARRALGAGPDGKPLLPPASHSGHYHLSSTVTVDALRASALLREGLAARDHVERVARLREGLQLVKAEPLAGVLAGYAWWRAEGHERRVADAVVDGACALVRAALGSGDIDVARWALAQARKVEPYSEALTRAAMRVAAESGDVRRLHAEWRECQRQVDELDPGGTPSERTEQLYAILRAQLAGESRHASFAAIDAAPLSTVPSAPSTV